MSLDPEKAAMRPPFDDRNTSQLSLGTSIRDMAYETGEPEKESQAPLSRPQSRMSRISTRPASRTQSRRPSLLGGSRNQSRINLGLGSDDKLSEESEGRPSYEEQTDAAIQALASARTRPMLASRGTLATTVSATSAATGVRSLPPLKRKETRLAQKEAHPWQHLGITLGLPMILLFDITVPCIIYYSWFLTHRRQWREQCASEYPGQDCPIPLPQFDKDILGSAIACFGIGELWILLARVWRLYFRQEECAPLLNKRRWELDATSWVYAVAMIVALIPFVVGSSLVIPKLYLYGPSFLMGFLGILMVITTLHPFNIPVGINSHARGSGLRPFIYYAAEDFIAVDGLQDREFRIRYNERYETNKMFRKFFFHLTLWWILGVCVYIGCVSAVIWTLEFHYAFGLSLGVLFAYIATWAACTYVWTKYEMRREHRAYEAGDTDIDRVA